MLGVIFIIFDVSMRWTSLIQTNRMRLFFNIIWIALFASKSIDHFIQWRNYGKTDPEAN
jgi:hypothetical protein